MKIEKNFINLKMLKTEKYITKNFKNGNVVSSVF